MLTLGLDHAWYPEQRHKELLAEAERLHLVQEALKTNEPKIRASSRIAAYLGKKLIVLGTRLAEHDSIGSQAEMTRTQSTTTFRI